MKEYDRPVCGYDCVRQEATEVLKRLPNEFDDLSGTINLKILTRYYGRIRTTQIVYRKGI